MHNLNVSILEFVNSAVGYYRPLDMLFLVATSFFTLAFAAVLVLFEFGVYLPLQVKGGERSDRIKKLLFIVGSVFLTYVVVAVSKVLIAYPRPFETLTNLQVLVTLPTDYSFPSGHAALTMALATAVYFFSKRFGIVLIAFAIVVGLARMYVGVHYPLDVLVGFAVGYSVPALLKYALVRKKLLQLP